MSKFSFCCLLWLIAVMPMQAWAIEPDRTGQEAFLKRAVFADGRLWILSDAGKLSHISEGQDTRIEEPLPGPALDLCVQDAQPVVITAPIQGGSPWTLHRRGHDGWRSDAQISTKSETLLAMDCAANRVTLLTTRRLIDINGDTQRAISLNERLGSRLISSAYSTKNHFFIGLNAGEWGGGLHRIDRRSGEITTIEHNSTGARCGGPLNTACDPVNGIAAEPWNPDCLVAAIGLVHFASHGRIVEICGKHINQIYTKPYEGDPTFSTVAFFGLIRERDVVWAVGIDGLYKIGKGGDAQFVPLPNFKEVGKIAVSFDIPHLVIVLTDINQRHSLSGSVPMLVPR